jgi:hypothetical protein
MEETMSMEEGQKWVNRETGEVVEVVTVMRNGVEYRRDLKKIKKGSPEFGIMTLVKFKESFEPEKRP